MTMTMTSPLPLKLAIFGLGRWGTHLLRNFLALPGAQVVALVDPDLKQLQDRRDRFHLGEAVTCYNIWPQALAHPGLDAVVIATPASTHYAMIKAALEAGLHVLSEKPPWRAPPAPPFTDWPRLSSGSSWSTTPISFIRRSSVRRVATHRPSPISSGQIATDLVRIMEAIATAVERGDRVAI